MKAKELRLSASANAAFLGCQYRYLLEYVYGLRSEVEKDSTRIGSLWHKCHELLELRSGEFCPRCAKNELVSEGCYICGGAGRVPEDKMDCVTRYLNTVYENAPDSKTLEDWLLERSILLYSLVGHQWYYKQAEEDFDVIGSELKLEVPVRNLRNSRKLSKTVFVIKIDRLVRDKESGLVYIWERKSTGRPLNEYYWDDLTQGDQIMGYLYGGREAQKLGLLAPYGVGPKDNLIAGAYCDVWHKPDISPKLLSHALTEEFLSTGEYYDAEFQVTEKTSDGKHWAIVNGSEISLIEGKQGYSLRETPEMFGARLLYDIVERPHHYFQRRAVTRTDAEIQSFADRLPKLASQIRYVSRQGLWLQCWNACNTAYRCVFYNLCRSNVQYKPGDPAPVGYKLGYNATPEIPNVDETEIRIGE